MVCLICGNIPKIGTYVPPLPNLYPSYQKKRRSNTLSVVISLRLDVQDLIGCYDLLGINNEEGIKNQKMGTVIKILLRDIIAAYREKEILPSYVSDSDAAVKLKTYLPDIKWAKDLAIEIEELTGEHSTSPDPEIRLREIIDPVISQVERDLDNESLEGLFYEPKNREEEEETKPRSVNPPWAGAKTISVEEILRIRPADGFLEEENANLTRAVMIAYARFVPERWAEDVCINLVYELYDRFKKWDEENLVTAEENA